MQNLLKFTEEAFLLAQLYVRAVVKTTAFFCRRIVNLYKYAWMYDIYNTNILSFLLINDPVLCGCKDCDYLYHERI